jgi:hypothetical protein
MRRKTPNTERPTPNAQPKAFRVNEANSESAAPKKTNYDLEDRLLEFAVAVVELTDDLPKPEQATTLQDNLSDAEHRHTAIVAGITAQEDESGSAFGRMPG